MRASRKTYFVYWIAGAALIGVSVGGMAVLHAAPTPPASVPISLTQQGRILDTTGNPISSKVAIAFTVYDDPTASASADVLWTETQNLTLDDGYFSTQLGAAAANAFPAGTFDGSVRYLGVKVGADAEMTPRQAITSVPYALHAQTADTTPLLTAWTKVPQPIVRLANGTPGTAVAGQTTNESFRRVGDSVEVMGVTTITAAIAGTGYLLWELPNGLATDASKLPNGYVPTGTAEVVDSTAYYVGVSDIETTGVLIDLPSTTRQSVGVSYPDGLPVGTAITFHFTAPVATWGVTP